MDRSGNVGPNRKPGVGNALREAIRNIDRPAWRRFFLALFALSVALFTALSATSLRLQGRTRMAWWMSVFSLALVGFVALKIVPPLARRTVLERWSLKVDYRLTREGILYLGVIGVIILAALNTGNNLLFMILASLLAGILISGIVSKIVLTGVELSFVLPEHVFAKMPVISQFALKNFERMLPSYSVTIGSRKEKKGKKKRGANPALAPRSILNQTVYVPYVPHQSRVSQEIELNFPRRGRYTQDGFQVSTRFPFGFLEKSCELPLSQEVLVYPNVQPTEEFYEILPLISGEMESSLKGQGHDLYSIRDYQESDSARHVDWKASAKLNTLQVREFTREDERRVVLAFDNRGPESGRVEREKFEKAVTFCACLAWHFFENKAQMQPMMDDWEIPMAPAGEVIYPMLERLAVVEPRGDGAAKKKDADLLARLAGETHGFNIIFTAQPRGSVPTSLWGTSYLIFIDAL